MISDVVAPDADAENPTLENPQTAVWPRDYLGDKRAQFDAAIELGRDIKAKKIDPDNVNEKTLSKYLDVPTDVDLFLRSSGEERISNFMLWQSAYAELVFLDVLWPDVDRRTLWNAIEIYAKRDRRFGNAK